MHRARIRFVMGFLLCSATLLAAEVRAQSDSTATVLETVLVVGPQPGPGLWKVSKDGNVLWILATYGPLPEKLAWQSRQVERILAESQELYTEPGFETYIGLSREEGRLMKRAMSNGEGATLQDVLPVEAYEKFSRLNQQYAKRANLDEFRPFIAAAELRRRSIRALTLTADGGVRKTLQRLARRHRVKVRSLTLRDNSYARPTVEAMAAAPPASDIPCFWSQLERLEGDLEAAVQRANAWAVGDVAALRTLLQVQGSDVCADLIRRNSPAQEGIAEATRRADAALRSALERNRSTLALMPIQWLFEANGVLARFRAAGYEVEEPTQ